MEWLIGVLIIVIIILIKYVIPQEREQAAHRALNPAKPLPPKEFYPDGSLNRHRYFDNELGYKIDIHRFKHNGEWKKSVKHHIGITYEERDSFNEAGVLVTVGYYDRQKGMRGFYYTTKRGWNEMALRRLERNHIERFEKLKIRHNIN